MRMERSSLELKAAAFSESSKRKRDLVGVVVSVSIISLIVLIRGEGFDS